MFKSKEIEVTVFTTMENEDHFKVYRIIDTYSASGTVIYVTSSNNDITIKFTMLKSLKKQFSRDILLMRFIGIDVRIKGE